ncbi:MAG TPA: radical SAM protein [Rhizomicrobium sp.]
MKSILRIVILIDRMIEGPGGASDREFVFVVKLSKFCNLRCRYCYEHAELHVRERMGLATVEKLFADIDKFGEYLSAFGISPTFSFVWHGGEPLLVPSQYFREVTALQTKHIRDFPYSNSVQSNLYGSNASALAYIIASNWQLGISIDFAPGVREGRTHRDSHPTVIANAEALHKSGMAFGVVSTLGKHNAGSIVDAYDWVEEFAHSWRILPLFEGGPETAIEELRLPDDEIAEIYSAIFDRRSKGRRHIPIDPIDGLASAALLKMAGARDEPDFRRDVLDCVFVVNVNGDIYTRPFAYDARHCMGNINVNGMSGLIRSPAYLECQRIIQRGKQENCSVCRHRGYCNSALMHEHWSVTPKDGRRLCVHPRLGIDAIENELRNAGVDRSTIGAWARNWLGAVPTELDVPAA